MNTCDTCDAERFFPFEFEVWQDDVMVASASGPHDDALREAMRYAEQYRQDGPVRVFEVTRTLVGPAGRQSGPLMNTCDTCRHWDRSGSSYEVSHRLGLGRCKAAEDIGLSTFALAGDGVIEFTGSSRDVGAFLENYEDAASWMLTKPDFGCTKWSAK